MKKIDKTKIANSLKRAYEFSNSWTGTVIIVLLIIFFVAQAFVIPSGSMKNTMLIGDHLFVKKFAYGVSTPRIPWLEIPVLPDFDGDGHLIEGDKPERGDIVIFRYPENEKIHYVKRCVAIEGDEVLYQDKRLLIRPHQGDEYIRANYPKEQILTLNGNLWVENPYSSKHKGVHYSEDSNSFKQLQMTLLSGANLPMFPVILHNDKIYPPHKDKFAFNAFYTKVPKQNYFMVGDNRDHSNDSRFWGFVPYKYIVGKPWFIYFSWDDDYKIRWNRIGKSIEDLEIK